MKRVLNLKKQVAVTSIFLGLLFTASSFTFGPVEDAPLAGNTSQEKVQRVKVTVNKDGKETKIDTTFNLSDEKAISVKVDSILNKLGIEGGGMGKSKVMIHRTGRDMNWNNPNGEKLPAEEQFEIMIQNGDSGKAPHAKKIFHIRRNGDLVSIGSSDGDHLMPPPPIPPHAPMIFHHRFSGDPFAFDPKDESIISYDKKDIGKGLEKITIIRKKKMEHQQDQKVQVKVETVDDSKK